MNLQQTIDNSLKEFDEKFAEDLDYFHHTGMLMAKLDIKSHLTYSIKKAVEVAVKEISDIKFQMDIKEYLPKVKAWKSGYDVPFDDGFAEAISLIEKKKSLFLHKCCDGECNHDSCCGKVPANCPLKDNK